MENQIKVSDRTPDDELLLVEDVPVFAENQKYEDMPFDRARLEQLVAINNDKIAQGAVPTIVVGHHSENERPALGFIKEFKMGVRNGLNTVFARLGVFPEAKDELKKYPHRSLEINKETLKIPAIALLGGSEPALELGLLYQDTSEEGQILKYSQQEITVTRLNIFEDKEPQMEIDKDFAEKVLEVLRQTDCYKWYEEVAKEMDTKEEEKSDVDKDEFNNEEEANPRKDESTKDEVEEETGDKAEEENKKEDKEDDSTYSAKEGELLKELADLKLKFQQSEVKADRQKALVLLFNQGYDFEVGAELEDCVDMNDKQFLKHLERLKRSTKQAPVNMKFNVKDVPDGGVMEFDNGLPSDEVLQKAKKMAIKQGIPFGDALKKLKSK